MLSRNKTTITAFKITEIDPYNIPNTPQGTAEQTRPMTSSFRNMIKFCFIQSPKNDASQTRLWPGLSHLHILPSVPKAYSYRDTSTTLSPERLLYPKRRGPSCVSPVNHWHLSPAQYFGPRLTTTYHCLDLQLPTPLHL